VLACLHACWRVTVAAAELCMCVCVCVCVCLRARARACLRARAHVCDFCCSQVVLNEVKLVLPQISPKPFTDLISGWGWGFVGCGFGVWCLGFELVV